MNRLQVLEPESRKVGGQIRCLPGAAPLRADRPGQLLDRAGPRSSGHLRGLGGDLERSGHESHGRELRCGDAVNDVEGGPAAPPARVVHGRKVV